MTTGMVQVTVGVPTERQGEFYELFGRWLEIPAEQRHGLREVVGAFLSRPEAQIGVADPELDERTGGWKTGRAWGPDDLDDAQRLYRSVSPMARVVLSFWAERPGEWLTGDDTAEFAGVKGAKGVAGTLSSVGKAAGKLNRQLPFEHKDGPTGASGYYQMTPLLAGLFAAARAATDR